jgi:tetratricopeptide (TPR) repeat protein
MPPIVMNDSDNQKVVLPLGNDKAYLINFWDPECADCAIELLEWKKERSKLPGELQIVTLLANANLSHEVGREFIEEHQLPFAWGKIESDSAFLLAKLLQKLFQTRDRFEAPASFLINRKGELISFALGKVSVDEINAEVAAIPKASETTEKRLNRLYGKGVWLAPVERENLLFVPEILLNKGEVALAANYVRRAWEHLSRHRKINDLLVAIGDRYFKAGKIAEGLNFYLNALNKGHLNPIVMNNAAWQLATNKDQRIRNGDLALKWAQKALQLTKGNQATYFDTLAAGYAEKGMFAEALRMVDMGLEKAEVSGDSLTKASLLKAKALYLRNRAFREE